MDHNKYSNFVRPVSPTKTQNYNNFHKRLDGEAAKKLYLEEVKDIGSPEPVTNQTVVRQNTAKYINTAKRKKHLHDLTETLSDKDLFVSAENDVDTLKLFLDRYPDKIQIVDDYGWSLLMIACQANSVDTVKELLERDVNTSVRDKAGNSAQSLVIKNKNFILADLLLSHKKRKTETDVNVRTEIEIIEEEFHCDVCNLKYSDRIGHLSSTIHNINASKGRKIPANYAIPPSNKGYQLMLKEGWDRESGLGPDGTGKKYPIKTIQKKDRKGLGLDKTNQKVVTEREKIQRQTKKARERQQRYNKRMEAKFRREFY